MNGQRIKQSFARYLDKSLPAEYEIICYIARYVRDMIGGFKSSRDAGLSCDRKQWMTGIIHPYI
jgi:hypothetical protein